MSNILITIFTSTYNRCHTIDRLFLSLQKQNTLNFEWLVIDDGSYDNTQKYFHTIQQAKQSFKIIYKKKQNGGKHRAINDGVKIANGKLFFIVDSDDYLTEDATTKIEKWFYSLDGSHQWAGIAGLRGVSSSAAIGNIPTHTFFDAKNTERSKLNLKGDKAEVYFTDILKKFPFPEIPGENFLTEEVIWNAIAREGYYIRWFNDIIYICEYLEDGLTHNLNLIEKKNPKGVLLWAKGQIQSYPDCFKEKVFAITAYYRAVNRTKSFETIAKDLEISKPYLLLSLTAFKVAQVIH